MSRKIFFIVNLADGDNVILSGNESTDTLSIHSDGLLTEYTYTDLPESFRSQYRSSNGEQAFGFDRRAKARRALANLKADNFYPDTIRIVEVGEFKRTIRPVKSWRMIWHISQDSGKTWDSWRGYASGFPTRAAARTAVANRKSADSVALSKDPGNPVRYEYTPVPVYAD